jgi:hypothetical protein
VGMGRHRRIARLRRHPLARLLPARAGGPRRADGAAPLDRGRLRVPRGRRAAGADRDPGVRRGLDRCRHDGARPRARAGVAPQALHAAGRGRPRARRRVRGRDVVGGRVGGVRGDDGGTCTGRSCARTPRRPGSPPWSAGW